MHKLQHVDPMHAKIPDHVLSNSNNVETMHKLQHVDPMHAKIPKHVPRYSAYRTINATPN
jgi:hypothetical protein